MTALPHLLVGALVGSFFPNPIASGIAGFVTHSLVDGIPHWDPPFFRGGSIHKRVVISLFLLIDTCVAIWILYSLRSFPSFFWGGVGGMILDLEYFVIVPLKLKYEIHGLPFFLHTKTGFYRGALFWLLLVFVSAWLLYVRFLDA